MNFAEKALFASMEKQPGQQYFVTGLKFDFFAVPNSNLLKIGVLVVLKAISKNL